MRTETIAQAIQTAFTARENARAGRNSVWEDRWDARLAQLAAELPSGSGFDAGTKIETVTSNNIVLSTAFHHMNSGGYYDGWTDHTVTVRPDWRGVRLRISGKNKNDIKDYIADCFAAALKREAPPPPWQAETAAEQVTA